MVKFVNPAFTQKSDFLHRIRSFYTRPTFYTKPPDRKVYKHYEHMFIMVRPRKYRFVGTEPEVLYFKPRAIPLRDLEEVKLNLEEFEAVRLKDQEGMSQEQCAKKMKISRPTFQRILQSARKKIADFLVNGKALRIEGGTCIVNARKFRCLKCGHVWNQGRGKGRPRACPKCGSDNIKSEHKIVNKL